MEIGSSLIFIFSKQFNLWEKKFYLKKNSFSSQVNSLTDFFTFLLWFIYVEYHSQCLHKKCRQQRNLELIFCYVLMDRLKKILHMSDSLSAHFIIWRMSLKDYCCLAFFWSWQVCSGDYFGIYGQFVWIFWHDNLGWRIVEFYCW